MPDQDVQIQYNAIVTGAGDVQALAAANGELANQVGGYTNKITQATDAQTKHKNALLQAHSAVREFHRELFVAAGVVGLLTFALNSMSKGSESAQIGLETLTGGINKMMGVIGNNLAMVTAFWGAVSGGASFSQAARISKAQTEAAQSLDTQVKLLNMESQLYKTNGDDMNAMLSKQAAERLALKKSEGEKSYQLFKDALDRQQAAEIEAFRLSEMGLKSHMQIARDFQKNLVGGALEGSTQSVLEKTLSGQHQTGSDVMKTFQAGFAKAISEAISQSLWTSLMGGGNFLDNLKNIFTGRTPAVLAAERGAKASEDISKKNDEMLAVLRQIAECTCSTAKSLGGGITGTITPPKTSGLQKAASIFGLIGSLGGLGNIGAGTPSGGSAPEPSLTIDPSVYTPHSSGGWIHSFPSGGEVPITAQPGEFVVRRSAAQQNKDLLRDINNGGKPVSGTQNVFVINANDASSFAAMLKSPSSQSEIEIAVIRAVMSNGSLRSILKNYAK